MASGTHTPIGEGYFLSGTTLYTYNSEENSWERKNWSGSTAYIKNCDNSLSVKNTLLTCKNKESVLTE